MVYIHKLYYVYSNATHVLLHCPAHAALRQKTWPEGAELKEQLRGALSKLEKTVGFIIATELKV